MTQHETIELVPPDTFERLMVQARHRLVIFVRGKSRYQNLVEIARVHQEFGNILSRRIYEATTSRQNERTPACLRGCETCCLVPSKVRGTEFGNFTMTVLDALTLIEHYNEIRDADAALPDKALQCADKARRTGGVVRCPHLSSTGECGIYVWRPVACKIWFSADLTLCNNNCHHGYQPGVNAWTDASNQLRDEFERPFETCVAEVAPDLNFRGYDFLRCFEEIAKFANHGLFGTLREKIDAKEQNDWDPFE